MRGAASYHGWLSVKEVQTKIEPYRLIAPTLIGRDLLAQYDVCLSIDNALS